MKPIPLAPPNLGERECQSVLKCVQDQWVSSAGPDIPAFEAEFSRAIGGGHATAVVNGTAALCLALREVGVQPGDAVIVPSLTFIATANAAAFLGAKVFLADVAESNLCLCPNSLERTIAWVQQQGSRIGAIVPVHLYGQVAPMQEILALAGARGIPVVEDATEALGSTYRGTQVGLLGTAGCFSFNGNKIITTGGGGMIVSRDKSLINRARHVAQQSRCHPLEFEHDEIGFNFRLTNLQAALGRAQLERLQDFVEAKRRAAAHYAQALAPLAGLRVVGETEDCRSSFWMSTILVDADRFGLSAHGLIEALQRRQIMARPLFKPLHSLELFEPGLPCPVAERLYEQGVNLPCGTSITSEELYQVTTAICEVYRLGVMAA